MHLDRSDVVFSQTLQLQNFLQKQSDKASAITKRKQSASSVKAKSSTQAKLSVTLANQKPTRKAPSSQSTRGADDLSRQLALSNMVSRSNRDYQRSPGKIFRVTSSQSAKNSESGPTVKRQQSQGTRDNQTYSSGNLAGNGFGNLLGTGTISRPKPDKH